MEEKGDNKEGVKTLSQFIKDAGLTRYVWKSDQEKTVKAMVESAVIKANRDAAED